MTSNSVLMVVDNLRVGGIQRLALDEVYALSERDFVITLLLLEKEYQLDDMREIDSEYFEKSNIKVICLPKTNWRKVLFTALFIRKNKIEKAISHSAKGIAILRVASILNMKKLKVLGYIHQLISLSDGVQRAKRLVFFSLATELYASSNQFVLEISSYLKTRRIGRFLFRKKVSFDRMGVFLNRIRVQNSNSSLDNGPAAASIIFMSRVAVWKGFGRFIQIAGELGRDFDYVVITSRFYNNAYEVERLCHDVGARLLHGTNIARISRGTKSIHLYPTDYGPTVTHPQNIGMNVLESIALGIPSLISFEQFSSWPELANSILVQTTDWNMLDVEKKVKAIVQIPTIDLLDEAKKLERVISIETHVDRIVKFLN